LSSILGKAWLPAIAVLAVFAIFAFGSQVRTAEADVIDVDVVDATFVNSDAFCDESDASDISNYSSSSLSSATGPLRLEVGDTLAICIETDTDLAGDVVDLDSNDYGEFTDAICSDEDGDGDDFEVNDDQCDDVTGLGSDDVQIPCGDAGPLSDCEGDADLAGDADILVFWDCEDEAGLTEITISQTDGPTDADLTNDVVSFWVMCFGHPDFIDVTASHSTVEIVPAIGSSAHSEITIALSADGLPVDEDDIEIDVSVPKCAIEIGNDNPDSSPLSDNWPADSGVVVSYPTAGPNDDRTVIDNIWFHADWNNCTPGDVVVTVVVEVDDGADLVDTVTIKIVGPPAFITATAAPDRLICGEKSTITVKVTDAIGQNVSNNTPVELISNWGSVIAGTGATLGFPGPGPVNPLASSAAATYNGVAVAYLLTSNNHVGPYEVVAAAGGTVGFYNPWEPGGEENSDPWWYDYGSNGLDRHDYNSTNALLYSGAPITTQVTVTCSLPAAPVAPTVTAPTTGTGSITPPNTGDAGLASSSSNAMLFVIVGAAAFVLAGIASVSYARR
jgi:hypothetical protein